MGSELVECPFCGLQFPENCDYEYGWGQITPNSCDNCGAYEIGGSDKSKATPWQLATGWFGPFKLSGMAARLFALGVEHGMRRVDRPEEYSPADSLAPVISIREAAEPARHR